MNYPIPCEPVDPHSDPTIVSLTSSYVLPNSAKYIVRVTPDLAGHTLTIQEDRSHIIQNEGSVSFNLATEGNATFSVEAGGQVMATWNEAGSNHELQVDQSGGSIAIDAVVSTSSANAVQNSAITSYVDSSIATITASPDVPYQLTYTSHGLTSASVGKPLVRNTSGAFSVWTDTSTSDPLYILSSVVSTSAIQVQTLGARISGLDNALIESTWSHFTDGPFLYWDSSADEYVGAKPVDAIYSDPLIQVLTHGASTFDALVLIGG